MSRKWIIVAAVALCVPAAWWLTQRMGSRIVTASPSPGISRALASERAGNISSVRYTLALSVPEKQDEPVRGTLGIRLVLEDRARVVLDFAQPAERVSSMRVNGNAIAIRAEQGHLIIPAEAVNRGANVIDVVFTAGDEALNRHDDFLYSLFVPAHASQAFPCFDQPDIKSALSLTLEIPAAWAAVSNTPEIGRSSNGDRATVRFGQTAALPTYLFGFAAGRFSVERGERNGRTFQMYHRETDADKVAANREVIFDLHQQAVEW